MVIAEMMSPKQICEKLAAWAEVAGIRSRMEGQAGNPAAQSEGALVVSKSDLLLRMIYAGEMPSQTECPVHKGVWSGMHLGWPGTFAVAYAEEDAVVDQEDHEMLKGWYEEGCRCYQHRGSQATTGWQPDEACGCVDPMRNVEKARREVEIEATLAQKTMADEEAKVLIGARAGPHKAMDERGLEAERKKRREGG